MKKKKTKTNLWKRLPYWKKGGIIGAVMGILYPLVILVILFYSKPITFGDGEGSVILFIFSAPVLVSYSILSPLPMNFLKSIETILFLFPSVVFSFVGLSLGALIGFIVGKVKKK